MSQNMSYILEILSFAEFKDCYSRVTKGLRRGARITDARIHH